MYVRCLIVGKCVDAGIEFFESVGTSADRNSILYNIQTGFLSSATGWPKSVAKWSLNVSSLTSAVLPLRRPVADEVLPVISLVVSHTLFT